MKNLDKKEGGRRPYRAVLLLMLFAVSSCSIKQMAYKSAVNAMAPLPEQKIKIKIDPNAPNPVTALTGEDDIELVGAVFPVILKLYEAMYIQNPKHRGLAIITGQLYIMYSNVFVETPAAYLSDNEFDKKNTAFFRAKKFYLRGAKAAISALDTAYPGFAAAVFSGDAKKAAAFTAQCKVYDAEALHWAGAGFLAAFALDPLDSDSMQMVPGAVLMLERVCTLNPEYAEGTVWEILTKFYASAPEYLGGSEQKAEAAYQKALELSHGKRPSVYVTYAQSFCIPKQDGKAFDKAIEQALSIDPEADYANKLTVTLAQNYAKWLKKHKNDFILTR